MSGFYPVLRATGRSSVVTTVTTATENVHWVAKVRCRRVQHRRGRERQSIINRHVGGRDGARPSKTWWNKVRVPPNLVEQDASSSEFGGTRCEFVRIRWNKMRVPPNLLEHGACASKFGGTRRVCLYFSRWIVIHSGGPRAVVAGFMIGKSSGIITARNWAGLVRPMAQRRNRLLRKRDFSFARRL